MIKFCNCCGEKYRAKNSKQKFCSVECVRNKSKDIYIPTALEELSAERAAKKEQAKIIKERRKFQMSELSRLAKEADEANMTYGQYVTYMERKNAVQRK